MATKPVFDDVAPWPERDRNPRAVIGNNKPPLEELIPAEFKARLLEERSDFMDVLERYVGKGSPDDKDYIEGAYLRAVANDDESLSKCGDLQNALRALKKHVTEAHKDVKAPYLEGTRLVDAEKNALFGRINEAGEHVQKIMDTYAAKKLTEERQAEREREAQREKLAELARENGIDASLLPASDDAPAKRGPIRSDAGAAVSVGTEWVGVVEDYGKAFRALKLHEDAKVREAIDAAVKRTVKATKGTKPINGVRISERAKTGSR